MKYEARYWELKTVTFEAHSLEIAGQATRKLCDQNGYMLVGVTEPGVWESLAQIDPPKFPPPSTPPSGTPGTPSAKRVAPPADLIARAA